MHLTGGALSFFDQVPELWPKPPPLPSWPQPARREAVATEAYSTCPGTAIILIVRSVQILIIRIVMLIGTVSIASKSELSILWSD